MSDKNSAPEKNRAIELDKELQEYLTAYFNRNKSEQQENVSPEEVLTDRQREGIKEVEEDNLTEVNTTLANDWQNGKDEYSDDLPF